MGEFDLDTARRRVANAREVVGIESEWFHLVRGTRYWVQAVGIRESDGEPLVIYREKVTGTCWVRPFTEFMDGRFTRLFPDA